jgi:short-subunit dehydrogenase
MNPRTQNTNQPYVSKRAADPSATAGAANAKPRSGDDQKTWVLITGASSGFGEEFAHQYAELGYSLVLVARRLDRLQALAQALRADHGTEVIVEQVDLSRIEDITRLHERLAARGIEVETLINNAGHGLQGAFGDTSLEAALGMIQLDVASLTAVTHVFGQDMRRRGRGKILLVASLLAYQGVRNFAVYSAAKAYVLRLGEALHQELKSEGITVTTLCPGASETGFAGTAQMKITPILKPMLMKPAPVVRSGIRALEVGRMSIVPGFANKFLAAFTWATPRRIHQAMMSQAMNG